MSGPRRAARTTRRTIAGLVAVAVLLTGCGDDTGDATVSVTSPTPPGIVPNHHGLPDALVDEVLASTVGISGVACGRLANGSGFAISDRLIVTNAHVVSGIDEIHVHTFEGADLDATPVAYDPDADLAVLEVADTVFTPLALSTDADEGTVGMLVGWETGPYPDPTPFRIDRRVTVRIERVGSTERVSRRSWLLAADVESGDSGAALVDGSGQVVGVAFAASTQGLGVGYAVRASEVEDLMSRGLDANLSVPDC